VSPLERPVRRNGLAYFPQQPQALPQNEPPEREPATWGQRVFLVLILAGTVLSGLLAIAAGLLLVHVSLELGLGIVRLIREAFAHG
jgi:hypothetical protein